MSTDKTNPPHYKDLTPEPIDVIEGWGLGFNLGNCVKYIARAGRKPETSEVEDIRKALWYLQRHLSSLEKPDGTEEKPNVKPRTCTKCGRLNADIIRTIDTGVERLCGKCFTEEVGF